MQWSQKIFSTSTRYTQMPKYSFSLIIKGNKFFAFQVRGSVLEFSTPRSTINILAINQRNQKKQVAKYSSRTTCSVRNCQPNQPAKHKCQAANMVRWSQQQDQRFIFIISYQWDGCYLELCVSKLQFRAIQSHDHNLIFYQGLNNLPPHQIAKLALQS